MICKYCKQLLLVASWEYVNDFGECTTTCGGGKQTRTQSCVYSDNATAQGQCSGDAGSESRGCNVEPCRKLFR